MRTFLLIIDAQTSLIEEGAWNAPAVLANISLLLARAREAGAPVIFIRDVRVEPDGSIHGALEVRPGDAQVEKPFCDAFLETPLLGLLEAGGAGRLVVAGLQTDYCVDTTCRRAASLGFQVLLASDAHTTFDHDTLDAARIVAHHNRILRNFPAGRGRVRTLPASQIGFLSGDTNPEN